MRTSRVGTPTLALAASLILLGSSSIYGQDYPNKSIRMVTSGIGGGNDFIARAIGQGLTPLIGQAIVVDNREGPIGPESVARATPDGYTLLSYSGSIWTDPYLKNTKPYDPATGFTQISWTASSPNVLVVHPSVAANSVKELISLAKAKPGVLNYAAGQSGSTAHLAGELFKSMAGVDIVRIPYNSSSGAIIALLSGQVQMQFASSGSVVPQIKSGKLRALAVTSLKASALFPDLPTVTSSGLPGYEMIGIYGIWAPPKTPGQIVARLNHEIVRVVHQPDVREKFLNTGVEAVGSSPQEFVAAIKADMAKWGKFIKESGIRAEQ